MAGYPPGESTIGSVTIRRIAGTLAVLLVAGYAGVAAFYSAAFPLQDYPNHLARAFVISDLLWQHSGDFSAVFEFHFLAVPYVMGDLLLAALIGLFGLDRAASVWNVLVVVSLPVAVYVYSRVAGMARNRIPLAVILSLYCATDWFFLKGFIAFRLGVATVVLTLALIRSLRDQWSAAGYFTFVIAVAFGYLMHLTVTVFEGVALGATGLLALGLGRSTRRRELALLAPVAVMLLWQFVVASHYRHPQDAVSDYYFWGTWLGKLTGMGAQFVRFSPNTDLMLLLALAACVVLTLRRECTARHLAKPAVLDAFALAAAFFVLYFVLPVGYADAWYVDARAMEMALLFLLLGCLLLPNQGAAASASSVILPVALAALLADANLAYLNRHFRADAEWLAQYRSLLAAVPRGAWVLPIYQQPREGAVRPLLHAGSYAVIDARAPIPYLFSADGGYPMSYFRYRDPRYAPDEAWYSTQGAVDWRRVTCAYDYLLVMKPFDGARLQSPATPLAANAVAELLRVDHGACH